MYKAADGSETPGQKGQHPHLDTECAFHHSKRWAELGRDVGGCCGGRGAGLKQVLGCESSHVKKHHLLRHIPERCISAHLFEDFPFA